MDNFNKYNRKEMEERLPDYIFGTLAESEKEIFEATLTDYPEFQDEIQQVRHTFAMLDKIDFDKVLFDKTKDLPTRVARQVAQNKIQSKRFFVPLRFLVPALITAGLFFVAIKMGFIQNDWTNTNPKTTTQISYYGKINTSVEEILSDIQVQTDLAESNDLSDFYSSILDKDELFNNIDSYYNQFLFDINSDFNTVNSPSIETYLTINTNINNINEDIFEEIIEEIKNANFKS